jgi:hypothetical protein
MLLLSYPVHLDNPVKELRIYLFRAFEPSEVKGKPDEDRSRRSYIPLPLSRDLFLNITAKFDLSDFQATESEC